ncbi:uncharacterized protein LOC8271432 [Ricinus communis]|uniref:Uncharacterized protein n=1 Tax=Ricinus communis TaxID=3988 RepID=B9RBG3_RICCO|nr:uncharacterized protein LOC8271432 [Ricinus communis]EEF50884.1 conserved hypothetical protein [Ricinus communis]|eukprot:XP_002509497.1 uncharacterized protein LOC8271432 [Ricinus communis]
MESNRKRRVGFMKGKLMPFYRSPKPTTTNVNQYSSKVIKPSQSSSTYNVVHHHHHHQDYIIAPPKQKVSFVVPAAAENNRADKLLSQLDKLYGISVDESVDVRTATYISSVQERFKLERSNSERVKFEDKK